MRSISQRSPGSQTRSVWRLRGEVAVFRDMDGGDENPGGQTHLPGTTLVGGCVEKQARLPAVL